MGAAALLFFGPLVIYYFSSGAIRNAWARAEMAWYHNFLLAGALGIPSIFSVLLMPMAQPVGDRIGAALGMGAIIGGASWICIFLFGSDSNKSGESHRRGQAVATAKEIAKETRRQPHQFTIGGVPIPSHIEPLSFLLDGAQGSGKSQAFLEMLEPVRKNRQRAIVADMGGEFLSRLYQPGDIILNPFDSRSVSWSPLSEMRGIWDAKRLAASIIPDGHGAVVEWNQYAQTIVEGVLRRLWEKGEGSNAELLRLLTTDTSYKAIDENGRPVQKNELADLMEGLPASRLFALGNERMLGSIMGIVGVRIGALEALDPDAGFDSFSIKKWIEQDGENWLFVTSTDDQLTFLKPLIGAVVDVAASSVLSLNSRNPARRIWFSLDEYTSIAPVQSIADLLQKGRKYGGCVVMGVQSLSQLFEKHGERGGQSILGTLSTWLCLRSPDPQTAEYISKFVGDAEVRRVMSSGGESDGKSSSNWAEQIVTKRAVLASEFQNLDPLIGMLSIAGSTRPCWVNIPISKLERNTEEFQAREMRPRPQKKPQPPVQQEQQPIQKSPEPAPQTAGWDMDDLP